MRNTLLLLVLFTCFSRVSFVFILFSSHTMLIFEHSWYIVQNILLWWRDEKTNLASSFYWFLIKKGKKYFVTRCWTSTVVVIVPAVREIACLLLEAWVRGKRTNNFFLVKMWLPRLGNWISWFLILFYFCFFMVPVIFCASPLLPLFCFWTFLLCHFFTFLLLTKKIIYFRVCSLSRFYFAILGL